MRIQGTPEVSRNKRPALQKADRTEYNRKEDQDTKEKDMQKSCISFFRRQGKRGNHQ